MKGHHFFAFTVFKWASPWRNPLNWLMPKMFTLGFLTSVFDDEQGQYLIFRTGWKEERHLRYMPLYVCLRNGKIWVEEDWTEEGVTTYFLEQGVPHQDIVLGFQPPQMRPFTEFATV